LFEVREFLSAPWKQTQKPKLEVFGSVGACKEEAKTPSGKLLAVPLVLTTADSDGTQSFKGATNGLVGTNDLKGSVK
jgi:hypothetical protein